MTEDQAIQRIARAIKGLSPERTRVNRWDMGCAEAAWNEMRAMALEDRTRAQYPNEGIRLPGMLSCTSEA